MKIQTPPKPHEELISLQDFLLSYNQNLPSTFPKASEALLLRYKKEHTSFFKHGDRWSLDQHRKKIIDWLPQNIETTLD